MAFRRWRRKVRCLLKHGPRGCPHIERHTRRSKKRKPPRVVAPLPSARPRPRPSALPAALTEALSEDRPVTGGRHALPTT